MRDRTGGMTGAATDAKTNAKTDGRAHGLKSLCAVLLLAAGACQSPATAIRAQDSATGEATPEAIEELFNLAGMQASFQQTTNALLQSIAPVISRTVIGEMQKEMQKRGKEVPQRAIQIAADSVTKTVLDALRDPSLNEEIIKASIPIFAKYFTADEIRQLTAFYRSPVGVKTVRLMPQMTQDSIKAGEEIAMSRMSALEPTIMRNVKKSLEEAGYGDL